MTLTLSLNGKGYSFRGDGTTNTNTVFDISATETASATNTLTQITLTATGISFNNTVGGTGIVSVDILDGTTSIVTSTDINGSDSAAVVITVNDSFTADQTKNYTVKLQLASAATLSDSVQMELTAGVCSNGAITPAGGNLVFKVTGIDFTFDADATGSLIFDADRQKFEMLDFTLTPLDADGYFISSITVNNDGTATFDSGSVQTNKGVTHLYLYRDVKQDHDSNPATPDTENGILDSGDMLIKSVATFENANVSTESATIQFSVSDADSIRKVTTSQRYLLLYDIGVSSNIELNDSTHTVKAKITDISGTGVDSSLTYSPISISSNSENQAQVSMAGMVIKSVENIFPSMNAAAGLTDIPILKFTAKSVGVSTRLKSLVISNESKTFDSNGSGITNLKWVKDDSGGEYSGYSTDGPASSPDLDTLLGATFAINDSSKGTFTFNNASVDVASGTEQIFYILADFGLNMNGGQSVSLNISEDTRTSFDKDNDSDPSNGLAPDGDHTNDNRTLLLETISYNSLRIGSSLPLTVTPTQSITVVDPQLLIKTPLDVAISGTTVGLFCDTDVDANCTDGGGATKKLVAGMYDVLMYVFDFDTSRSLSGVNFEFQSPNRYFSQESIGISKLSLYLDKDKTGALSSGDVFLGSTDSFENSGKTATISNVSLPQGKDQKLLLLFDIGQRVVDSDDQLSIQLSNVMVSENVVAGMFPNPIVPYTYDVVSHKLKINELKSDISDTNVIDQDSTFDVTAFVEANEAGAANEIRLVDILNSQGVSTGVPLSSPKFYLGGVSGSNRSYEFVDTFNADASFDDATLFTNHANGTILNLIYQISAANITSEGNYLIDFDVYYRMTHTDYLTSSRTTNNPVNILFTRSKGAGTDYKSAVQLSGAASITASEKLEPSMTTTNKVFTWSLPSYIESVSVQVNNKFTTFNNYQSIPQNAKLKVLFANGGQDIDPNSISLQLNGETIKNESQVSVDSSDTYFEYDTQTGELILSSVGTSGGTLTLSANDNFGQPYPSAPLIFFASSVLEIEKFFVYQILFLHP